MIKFLNTRVDVKVIKLEYKIKYSNYIYLSNTWTKTANDVPFETNQNC